MRRVLVVGMSGAGKTTAGRRLAGRLGVPFHEVDALAIGPGWSVRPTLVADVAALVTGPGWIVDSWGRPEVRDALWGAADTVVWLDYPRRVVLPRLLRRSLRRSWRRERVFGGNVERWREWFTREHPVRHAVATFGARRAHLAGRAARGGRPRVVRLRSPAEFETWLRGALI